MCFLPGIKETGTGFQVVSPTTPVELLSTQSGFEKIGVCGKVSESAAPPGGLDFFHPIDRFRLVAHANVQIETIASSIVKQSISFRADSAHYRHVIMICCQYFSRAIVNRWPMQYVTQQVRLYVAYVTRLLAH